MGWVVPAHLQQSHGDELVARAIMNHQGIPGDAVGYSEWQSRVNAAMTPGTAEYAAIAVSLGMYAASLGQVPPPPPPP